MRRNWLVLAALAVAVLQIGFLSWIIAGRASVLRNGQEILLKVEPVDPRDLLRGDYVRLGYEIATIPAAILQPPPAGEGVYGDRPVWVLVTKGADGVFGATAASFDRAALAASGPDSAVLAGTASGIPATGAPALVTYGMERFYLPEGEGLQIEQDMRERPFFVVAAVAGNGTAQIKRFLDGETVLYEEPLY